MMLRADPTRALCVGCHESSDNPVAKKPKGTSGGL